MDSPTPDAPDQANLPTGDPPQSPPASNDGSLHVRPPQAGTPGAAPTPPADSTDADVVLFHGSVSLWMGWRSVAGSILAALTGLTLALLGWWHAKDSEVWSFFGTYIGVPLFLAGVLMLGYVYLSLRCLRYKITNRLIERERGIVVKRVDSLDLSRVKDVQLVQNLMERILRIGTIEILSSDRTDPLMRIEAIPKPRPVYEKLRDTVIRISLRRGIIAMDR